MTTTMMMDAFKAFRIGLGGGVDDDIVAQTLRTASPEEPFCSVFAVLSRCRTILYSHQTYFWTLGTRPWDFEGLSAKTRTWLGGSLLRG